MTVYEKIKQTAREKGLSLQSVAEKAGLSSNMIYQYKKVNPKLETAQKIAEVLGISVDYLLGNTDTPTLNHNEETPDMKRMLDNALTYDGKPLSDHDREVVRMFMETLKSED